MEKKHKCLIDQNIMIKIHQLWKVSSPIINKISFLDCFSILYVHPSVLMRMGDTSTAEICGQMFCSFSLMIIQLLFSFKILKGCFIEFKSGGILDQVIVFTFFFLSKLKWTHFCRILYFQCSLSNLFVLKIKYTTRRLKNNTVFYHIILHRGVLSFVICIRHMVHTIMYSHKGTNVHIHKQF